MAALDYRALRDKLPRARLLFVAHRKEILAQSRATFCQTLLDGAFGEMWVDGQRPNCVRACLCIDPEPGPHRLRELGARTTSTWSSSTSSTTPPPRPTSG